MTDELNGKSELEVKHSLPFYA